MSNRKPKRHRVSMKCWNKCYIENFQDMYYGSVEDKYIACTKSDILFQR